MAGVVHIPSSPSYEVPEFFWTVPQGCPRQPVSFLHPAMMPSSKQATSSSNKTKNNRCLDNRTDTVHTATTTVDTHIRTQEHTDVAGDETSIIEDLFEDLNMYCKNLARENQRETDASKQINAEGSKHRSHKDCDRVSDISEGEEEDYDRTQFSDIYHNNSLSDDGYHTEETKRVNVSINSVSSDTHSSAENHDQDSDCECHSCISEQRSINGECNSVVSEHCSNYEDENCSRTLDSDDEQNGSDIAEDDHDADEESDEDSDRANDDNDDSDDDSEDGTNNDNKSGDEQNNDDDDDSIIQDDDGDDEEGGWVSVDEEGNNYMPEIHHNPAYTANKWYNMPNRYIKGTSGSGNRSSYTSGGKPMRRSTPVLSRSMGTHGYNNNNPVAMYDEEELELYLRCKTGFNMPMRESYAFPRKTPDDIEEIVSFWETDFQVGKTMVPKIGSWEKKGIQPQRTCNHAHYNRYMAWKRLYIKWIECNRSLDQWYEKYSWLGLDSILLFKPEIQKFRCDDLM